MVPSLTKDSDYVTTNGFVDHTPVCEELSESIGVPLEKALDLGSDEEDEEERPL